MVGSLAKVQDVMDMAVGEVQVQVLRTAPFTATEHARASAMADLVTDVLERSRDLASSPVPARQVERAWSRSTSPATTRSPR